MFASRTAQLDDLLALICEDLQLSPSKHRLAEERYLAVGSWLEAEGSVLRFGHPRIYPQGSFRIGTTVRPLAGEEFDLDFVLELEFGSLDLSPLAVLDLLEARLSEHGTYRHMIERKKRCIRLTYTREFHLDILPARPQLPPQGTRVWIPDRELRIWLRSDPKGYATWFEGRSTAGVVTLVRKVEPLPDHETSDEKTPLQRVVQLLKRWRDIAYQEDSDDAPRSIVLTTLAGHAFAGSESTSDAFGEVVRGLIGMIESTTGPMIVSNPVLRDEVLSERWIRYPETYAKFVGRVYDLAHSWARLAEVPLGDAVKVLSTIFGEPLTYAALNRQAEKTEDHRRQSALSVRRSGGGLSVGSSATAVAVRQNTFFGDV
jgi:hypothetical protein